MKPGGYEVLRGNLTSLEVQWIRGCLGHWTRRMVYRIRVSIERSDIVRLNLQPEAGQGLDVLGHLNPMYHVANKNASLSFSCALLCFPTAGGRPRTVMNASISRMISIQSPSSSCLSNGICCKFWWPDSMPDANPLRIREDTSLTTEDCKSIDAATVGSWLDYCNSLLVLDLRREMPDLRSGGIQIKRALSLKKNHGKIIESTIPTI